MQFKLSFSVIMLATILPMYRVECSSQLRVLLQLRISLYVCDWIWETDHNIFQEIPI